METIQSTSRVPGYSRMSLTERAGLVAEFANLNMEEKGTLTALMRRRDSPAMDIGMNFRINGEEYMVPMVTEEASVVPAASNGARMVWNAGGFNAVYTGSAMNGQVLMREAKDAVLLQKLVNGKKEEIIEKANELSTHIRMMDATFATIRHRNRAPTLAANFIFDTGDAQGANRINGQLELAARMICELAGDECRSVKGIVTNLSNQRLVMVNAHVKAEDVGGREIAENIVWLSDVSNSGVRRSATEDESAMCRPVTENKGIMNGVEAVLRAMDNDTRAEHSAVEAYVSYRHAYHSLTMWEFDNAGNLMCKLTMPAQVAARGGAVGLYDQSRIAKRILSRGNTEEFHVGEFACVVGSVAVANNLAAMRAIADEGIQRGHMKIFEEQQGALSVMRRTS